MTELKTEDAQRSASSIARRTGDDLDAAISPQEPLKRPAAAVPGATLTGLKRSANVHGNERRLT